MITSLVRVRGRCWTPPAATRSPSPTPVFHSPHSDHAWRITQCWCRLVVAFHCHCHSTIIYSPRRRWRWWWWWWTPPALKMTTTTTTTAQQVVIAQALKRCSSLTNRPTAPCRRGSQQLLTHDQEEEENFVLAMPQPVEEAAIPDPMVLLLQSSLDQRKWKFPTSNVCQSDFGEMQANEPEVVFIVLADGGMMVVRQENQGNNRMAANPGWISLTVMSICAMCLCNPFSMMWKTPNLFSHLKWHCKRWLYPSGTLWMAQSWARFLTSCSRQISPLDIVSVQSRSQMLSRVKLVVQDAQQHEGGVPPMSPVSIQVNHFSHLLILLTTSSFYFSNGLI